MPAAMVLVLSQLSHYLDSLQSILNKGLRWLLLFMAVTVAIIVIARAAGFGSTAVQESVAYAHAFLFMLSLAYTALRDGHVRVDIFYRRFNGEQKAWLNLLGSCFFLLPFALFLIFISWNTMAQSWRVHEGSLNPGGLPFVYILKSLAPAAGFLLALQAISEIVKQLITVSVRSEEGH